jgi:hypothetical protein
MTLHINSFMEQAQTNPAIKQMNVDNKMNLSFQTYSYISIEQTFVANRHWNNSEAGQW